MQRKILPILLFLLCGHLAVFSQSGRRIEGPVIPAYGATFAVDAPGFATNTEQEYRVIFDIHDSPEGPSTVNPMLNTLARFINMHVQAGVPLENLRVAGVIHNKASKDAMNHEAYRERYGVDNPNIPLMEALREAGADIYMCGQSIHARKIDPERLAAPVQTALSAMTVLISLQNEGYTIIRF